jgi:hypothetical protein
VNDTERVRMAVQIGSRMYGPPERQRCAKHRHRWETYRWTWKVGEDPELGTPEMLRGCTECQKEDGE